MKMSMRLLYCALAAVAVLLLMPVYGCGSTDESVPPLTLSTSVPPEVAAEHGVFAAELYFVSEDGRRLAAEQHMITYELSGSRAQAAVKELVAGPDTDKLSPSIPSYFVLDRVEISDAVCSVYFNGEQPENEREWLITRAALAQTLYGVAGVESVNVFVNGVEPGYYGFELGALRPPSDTLDVYISSVKNEYETIAGTAQSDVGSIVTRTAALYYTDESDTLLIARNVDISYDCLSSKSELVSFLVERMMQDAEGVRIADSALPEGLEFAQEPRVTYISSGNSVDEADPPEGDRSCVVELAFVTPPQGTDYNLMCGALTMTLTGYLKDVTGVSIRFVNSAGESDDGSYFVRGDFSKSLGRRAYVLLPDADGTVLHRVACQLLSSLVNDPYSRLKALFTATPAPGVSYPVFSADDIERVYITDDIAVVNWKAGFSDKFRTMLEDESTPIPRGRIERLFVYSVVNTLCELSGVNRVWMLEDGQKLGLIENIYLGNPLMENPGLVLDE